MQNQKPRKRQPYAYWKEKILLWESSGLKPCDFCQNQGLSYKAFLNHKRKYFSKQGQKPVVHFVQAKPAAPVKNAQTGVLQLVLPNGVRIGVTPDLDLFWLQKVLSVAGGL